MPGLSTLASVAGQDFDGDDEEGLDRGTSVGRYLVLERLGAGAMGVVYAAYDQELDRKIAIKILRSREGKGDEALRQERLIREAKAIAKLSHPNVVGIFDVGVHEGRVFLAMEYLSGGTLRDWVSAKKRPWREIVKMFIEVGQGLAAAHAEGLIHRDFKPDNVLLDKQGKPKVVDFGLVRLTSAALDESAAVSTDGLEGSEAVSPSLAAIANLTRTGALAGTPAYMAPEQFLGKPIDARTDQFAFCVALHEALYGERPFTGETVMALAGQVAAGKMKDPAKESDVPGWIRKAVQRGLLTDPVRRHATFEDLLAALTKDPVAKVRRRVGVTLAVVALLAGLFLVQRRAERRRVEFERQISVRLADGRSALAEAAPIKDRFLASRARSFEAFDGNRREDAERIWSEALALSAKLDALHERAQHALVAALDLDPSRAEVRALLGGAIYERALLAELESRTDDLRQRLRELETVDVDRALRTRWNTAGSLTVRSAPAAARHTIERYVVDDSKYGRLIAQPIGSPIAGAIADRALEPGSYRLTTVAEGVVATFFPFVVKRGEAITIDVALPSGKQIPADYVFIPAGRYLFGDHDDEWRQTFLNAVPVHEKVSGAYLIKAHETTFGEWIEYLSALPPGERRARIPMTTAVQGKVSLRQTAHGNWLFDFAVAGARISALQGEKVVYQSRRADAATQDWLRMPVVGISPLDMQAYFDWLRATGRVPGARFCHDGEWERAARGADARSYPASRSWLDQRDANVDATYGRTPGAYGPDEVGRHPRSQSPFGVDDMSGNVWEVVASDEGDGGFFLRGGAYYQGALSARATNREAVEKTTRSHIVGLRVCSDAPTLALEANP